MIDNIRAMMHSSDDSLRKFAALFKAIVDGDVTAHMDGQLQSMFVHAVHNHHLPQAVSTPLTWKLPAATMIFLSVPNSRRRTFKKSPHSWKSLPPPCARRPSMRDRPTS